MLARHYRPDDCGASRPSWRTLIVQSKDSLWSVALFRCESILLRSFRVMVVMDIFTRRIVGFGVARAHISGISMWMFNHAIAGQRLPKPIDSNNDPHFRFHRWLAYLRVLDADEIKSVPPCSRVTSVQRKADRHESPRTSGSRVLFWNTVNLTRKLNAFGDHCNALRIHRTLDGSTPAQRAGASSPEPDFA